MYYCNIKWIFGQNMEDKKETQKKTIVLLLISSPRQRLQVTCSNAVVHFLD